TQSIPILPHDIIAAAHCLAPLDDLHLAHLVNDLKPPVPVWSLYNEPHPSEPARGPVIESNDRLRSDELADLPAPEAERLHAAYDIEDHLDGTPDRLLVYGPSTPLVELLKQVKDLLIKNRSTACSAGPQLARGYNKNHQHPSSLSSYDQPNHVYVARVWFQPEEGLDGLYKWAKGGADLIRFELAGSDTFTQQEEPDPVVINWCPVEVALSQALEVGHQLLALLHSRQFSEILRSIKEASAEFRAINPIVWLVDPVEYAHAQLRETTEWGWSEHHVELNPFHSSRRACAICPSSNSSFNSISARDPGRHLSKSHLSQELCPLNHDQDKPEESIPPDSHPAALTSSSSSLPQNSKLATKNQIDNLPSWLEDLLDRRLPRLLSLPDGCLSYELLNCTSSSPANTASNLQACRLPPVPFSMSSPPSEQEGSSAQEGSSPLMTKIVNSRWSALSVLGSPSRPFGMDQRSVANSVPSFDQHYIPSPGLNGSLRHGQTNTLRYYPCKACAEHAFKLALSHKLNEEKRRAPPRSALPMRPSRSSQAAQHAKPKRASKNGSTGGTADWLAPDAAAAAAGTGGPSSSASHQARFPLSIHNLDSLHSFSTAIDHHPSACAHPPSHHGAPEPILASLGSSATSPPTLPEPVIGLGVKGKALKEAMDREHDEFIKHHHHQSLLSAPTEESSAPLAAGASRHTWDEGEAVED
ncbi:hypothetical protein PCANC_10904, partial [Puccinia coronata f. sp. avenae]